MKKNETLILLGLVAVGYFLFSQGGSQAAAPGNVNIPPPGGFVGPCQPPYVTGPSGCILSPSSTASQPASTPVYYSDPTQI